MVLVVPHFDEVRLAGSRSRSNLVELCTQVNWIDEDPGFPGLPAGVLPRAGVEGR
jgi:hypothetical protein